MVHADTVKKVRLCGGPKSFLKCFERDALPLYALPTSLGGTHPGVLMRQAIADRALFMDRGKGPETPPPRVTSCDPFSANSDDVVHMLPVACV